jgi:CMP-N,N'-diacetyllegionaminic acid synthase
LTTHALIPARSGSKSIPNKNMALLGGKPLVQWAIEAAQAACDEVFVVGDVQSRDVDITARASGATFLSRPAHLARDESLIIDLISWFAGETGVERLALVQPTSPFVTALDIVFCMRGVAEYGYASVQTIAPVAHNDHEQNQRILGDRYVEFAHSDRAHAKQGKPERYKFGNCVALDVRAAKAQRTPFPNVSFARVLDNPFRAIDIDGPDDLKLAEAILKAGLV